MNTHHIQRQNIEVHLHGTEQQGYDVQYVLREWCSTTLPEVLARVLAPYDHDLTVHIIEHLDLDLGTLTLQDLQSDLSSLIQDKLGSVLAEAIATQLRDHDHRNEHTPADTVSLDRPAARLKAVLYFFKHGRLPWWYSRESGESIQEMLFGTGAASKTTSSSPGYREFLHELRETLLSNATARQRMMMQLRPPSALRLIQDMFPPLQPMISTALTAIGKPPITASHQEKLQAGLVYVLLQSVGDGRTEELTTHDSVDITIRSAIKSKRTSLVPEEQRELLTLFGLNNNKAGSRSDATVKDIPTPALEELRFSEDADVFTNDGLFVRNAGIVLLHPFLPQYLRATNVAVDDELRDVDRALLLIHHLTTGSLTADEDELLLTKVLCGVPIEMPIELCTPVTDYERDEASGLLRAVIQYWDALRTTTPDGLRGNFITRLGRLDLHESEWLLRVERESHDILLDHLPWGFSHVKLPWMDRLVRVEW